MQSSLCVLRTPRNAWTNDGQAQCRVLCAYFAQSCGGSGGTALQTQSHLPRTAAAGASAAHKRYQFAGKAVLSITPKITEQQNYVYILMCGDGTLYTGWTNDPAGRLKMHNAGKGAKYTRARLPVAMVYRELMPSKPEALSRECEIKRLTRAQKLELIAAGKHQAAAE